MLLLWLLSSLPGDWFPTADTWWAWALTAASAAGAAISFFIFATLQWQYDPEEGEDKDMIDSLLRLAYQNNPRLSSPAAAFEELMRSAGSTSSVYSCGFIKGIPFRLQAYVTYDEDRTSGYCVTVTTFRSSLDRLLEIVKANVKVDDAVTYNWNGETTPYRNGLAPILPDSVEHQLQLAMSKLRERCIRFAPMGLPATLGLIFVGEPGTGKSTARITITRMLYDMWKSIPVEEKVALGLPTWKGYGDKIKDYSINSQSSSAGEDTADWLEESLRLPVIKFVEDIDRADIVDMGALLSGIDYFRCHSTTLSPRILVFTANSLDIPPVLIRPGRIDDVVFFPRLTDETIRKSCQLFWGREPSADFYERFRDNSPALLSVLLQACNDEQEVYYQLDVREAQFRDAFKISKDSSLGVPEREPVKPRRKKSSGLGAMLEEISGRGSRRGSRRRSDYDKDDEAEARYCAEQEEEED